MWLFVGRCSADDPGDMAALMVQHLEGNRGRQTASRAATQLVVRKAFRSMQKSLFLGW